MNKYLMISYLFMNTLHYLTFFVAIITGDTPDDIYTRVKECIALHSSPMVWVPSSEKLWSLNRDSVPPEKQSSHISPSNLHDI